MENKNTVFLTDGLSAPHLPDFSPAKADYDPGGHKTRIKTDRFGTAHIYYAWNKECGAIGKNFKEVSNLASSKKLDWLGIGGFLRFGFFPDDRTYYQDVKILKPATEYVFDGAGALLDSRRYWDWKYEPDYKRSCEQTVEAFADIFHQVIQKQTAQGRIAVPISGGLDSRSTAAALQNVGWDKNRFWSYSYGYSDKSIETEIAREIAVAAEIPFRSFTIKPYLFKNMDSIFNALEGFQDIAQARQAFVIDEIKKHADSVICAHWGDVWMDSMLKTEIQGGKRGTQDELTELIFNKFKKRGSDELISLFKEHVPSDLDDQLKHMIFKKVQTLQNLENDDFKIKAFKTDWWSFRWTLTSIRIFAAAAKPLLPFYDDRIADFFMTVPAEYVASRKLQIDYLKRYAPNLARIKWQVYDANLYEYRNFNIWQLPKRILKKTMRILSGRKTYQRNWEVQLLGPEARAGFEGLLKNSMEIKKLVSPERLERAVRDFYKKPDPAKGYVSSMLVTLSAALRRLA